MNITQKSIIDDIKNLLSKFKVTDENRINDTWLAHKINQVRAQLIVKRFSETEQIDFAWISDLGRVSFHKVNFADDSSVDFCECDISKAELPQVINLSTRYANNDLGIYSMISTCGKNKYYPMPLPRWRYVPKEHEASKFHYYARTSTATYVNKEVDSLRILAILQDPTDAVYVQSQAIASGSIVSGTVYIVKDNQVIYDSVIYNPGDTFTGTATTTFAGIGKVYLYSQARAFIETDNYPISTDMVRDIVIEICTKEFQIEKGQIVDERNDSEDDSQKS